MSARTTQWVLPLSTSRAASQGALEVLQHPAAEAEARAMLEVVERQVQALTTMTLGCRRVSRDPSKSAVSRILDCECAGVDRAGERYLGQATRRGDLVAAQEYAVAAIDRWTIAPAGARQVQRAAAAVYHLAPAPGDAPMPVLEGDVEQKLEARGGVLGALGGSDRHLCLHEVLAGRRERRVLRRVALARDDRHAERARATLQGGDQHRPAADDEPCGRPRREQQPLGALPDERGGELARVVVERVDAGSEERRSPVRASLWSLAQERND